MNISPHLSLFYLDSIVNNLPHFLFWKDADSRFLGCNRKFSESAGLSNPSEIIGKTDYDMPWGEMAEAYIADDKKIMTTGVAKLDYEESQPQPDGREKTMLVSKVPIYNDNHAVIGVLGIYTDISERKELEKQLIHSKEEAEAANALKSEFIRNMEHDIRTPFSGILGLTKILDRLETESTKKQIVSDILSCTQELLEYCSSILDFSKMESGVFPLQLKKFSLKKLIDGIYAIESPAAKVKKLSFSVEYDENIPFLFVGDSYRLERILINLISNAIKFTAKGFVRLSIKQIQKFDDQSIVIGFIVEDTGIGIPADKLHSIYEKFTRISPSNKGAYKGQGLGLHIVKKFAEEMDGKIEVESTLNQGSRFSCHFPFKLPLFDHPVSDKESQGV